MKFHSLFLLLVCMSCGGSLSDEQREKIKEGLEQQKIVKVSEAEIMEEALQKGQDVFKAIKDLDGQSPLVDSVARNKKVKIRFAVPGKNNSRALEQELIDAYINGITTGSSQENIQKIWTSSQKNDYDSLLYTYPKLKLRPDGVEELQGIWTIYMARKDMVLNIGRRK